MTTENIGEIAREIDTGAEPENIAVECDQTGRLVEFHRDTQEEEENTKTA